MSKRIVRTATVAVVTFSVAMAVAGVVLYLEAVTSLSDPAEPAPAATVPQDPNAQPSPGSAQSASKAEPDPDPWPVQGAAAEARRIGETRTGVISFAVIGPGGATVEFEPQRQFYSASVSKALLLVAELRRLRREGSALDSETRATLERMITLSDNEAADAIYARVGDAGLNEVAEAAGMTGFAGDVGHWSNVKITAGDMALFMSRLDELLDLPHGEEGSEFLASVISSQAWGIPQAAPEGARVRFKGGWRPADTGQLVHQAATVDASGERYSLAILTDGNPSQTYGQETIRLIARELLRTSDHPVELAQPHRGGDIAERHVADGPRQR